MTLSMKYELCSPLWLMFFNRDPPPPNSCPRPPHFLLAATISAENALLLFHFNQTAVSWWVRTSINGREQIILSSWWARSAKTMPCVPTVWHHAQKEAVSNKKKRKIKRWKDVSRADKNAACGGSNLKWLGKRWQHLPRLDLQSYQVEVCWRCSTWSLPALLWQRTGLDHWRWLGGLGDRDVGGL